ncbi:hypothetical protein F4803DRAFT_30512 [Xylaria telfairii]|nr:hypothetical protein F4803DRAFT_30512 [Xylaria telfairii]
MAMSAQVGYETIHSWYAPSLKSNSNLFEDAFNDAKAKFCSQLSQDKRKADFLRSKQSLHEVQDIVTQSMAKYEGRNKDCKARKWFERFSKKLVFYGNVLDVFVQHHPEFVALAWGAMKLVFTAVVNNETTASMLAEAMVQIADSLPQVELASILYPNDRMRLAVVDLNAYILKFLIRAKDWYAEGRWKHAWHSLTSPPELRYDDLLRLIREKSRLIDQLSKYCQQIESRKICEKVSQVDGKLDDLNKKVETNITIVEEKLEKIYTTISWQSSALVSTNQIVSDLQFANIMTSISDTAIGDPVKIRHYLFATRQRASRTVTGKATSLSRRFWDSPLLDRWNTSMTSDIAILRGQFQSIQALRYFCTDVIEYLSDLGIPIIYALKIPIDEFASPNISCIDLIKYILRQALQIRQKYQTEKSMSLACAPFHGNYSEAEWFRVLEYVLSGINRPVYLLLDLELINRDLIPSQGFSWFSAFRQFFETLSQRQLTNCLKVLLITHGSELPFTLSPNEYSEFVLSTVADMTRARRRKPRPHGMSQLRKRFKVRG